VKYAWIDAHRKAYPLPAVCETLTVSISGYRAWKRGGSPKRKRLTDAQMLALIQAVHKALKGTYGSPRMVRELRARGYPASKPRAERLMRENGIRARHKRRYKATTDSNHRLAVAANWLDRNFSPAAPNRAWSADITYIWTDEGWLYLAVVLDLFNREIVGWSIKPRMTADIVMDALTMAWFRRQPAAGLIHHSDRGSQGAFNRSSQHLLPEELRWEYRNTVAVGEASDLTLARLAGRTLGLRGSVNASGLQLPGACLPKLLQPLRACPQLSVRAGSGKVAVCPSSTLQSRPIATCHSRNERRLPFCASRTLACVRSPGGLGGILQRFPENLSAMLRRAVAMSSIERRRPTGMHNVELSGRKWRNSLPIRSCGSMYRRA